MIDNRKNPWIKGKTRLDFNYVSSQILQMGKKFI